jgi:hypothetical protein
MEERNNDVISGFVPGIVRDNEDPEGTGRVKAEIPGVYAPYAPYWINPMWPAKKVGEGAQYPPPDAGTPIGIIFMYGRYRGPGVVAFYFTGYYGITEAGASAGPTIIASAASAAEARKRWCFWESEHLVAYGVDDPENDNEKLVLQSKVGGSKIELNVADGAQGKSESIYIEAKTLLSLYSFGLLDIAAKGLVQIQGRRVSDLTKKGI